MNVNVIEKCINSSERFYGNFGKIFREISEKMVEKFCRSRRKFFKKPKKKIWKKINLNS